MSFESFSLPLRLEECIAVYHIRYFWEWSLTVPNKPWRTYDWVYRCLVAKRPDFDKLEPNRLQSWIQIKKKWRKILHTNHTNIRFHLHLTNTYYCLHMLCVYRSENNFVQSQSKRKQDENPCKQWNALARDSYYPFHFEIGIQLRISSSTWNILIEISAAHCN